MSVQGSWMGRGAAGVQQQQGVGRQGRGWSGPGRDSLGEWATWRCGGGADKRHDTPRPPLPAGCSPLPAATRHPYPPHPATHTRPSPFVLFSFGLVFTTRPPPTPPPHTPHPTYTPATPHLAGRDDVRVLQPHREGDLQLAREAVHWAEGATGEQEGAQPQSSQTPGVGVGEGAGGGVMCPGPMKNSHHHPKGEGEDEFGGLRSVFQTPASPCLVLPLPLLPLPLPVRPPEGHAGYEAPVGQGGRRQLVGAPGALQVHMHTEAAVRGRRPRPVAERLQGGEGQVEAGLQVLQPEMEWGRGVWKGGGCYLQRRLEKR